MRSPGAFGPSNPRADRFERNFLGSRAFPLLDRCGSLGFLTDKPTYRDIDRGVILGVRKTWSNRDDEVLHFIAEPHCLVAEVAVEEVANLHDPSHGSE